MNWSCDGVVPYFTHRSLDYKSGIVMEWYLTTHTGPQTKEVVL